MVGEDGRTKKGVFEPILGRCIPAYLLPSFPGLNRAEREEKKRSTDSYVFLPPAHFVCLVPKEPVQVTNIADCNQAACSCLDLSRYYLVSLCMEDRRDRLLILVYHQSHPGPAIKRHFPLVHCLRREVLSAWRVLEGV